MLKVRYSAINDHSQSSVLIPTGLETPHGRCVSVTGGAVREVTEHYTRQKALLLDVTSDQINIEFAFDTVATDYPEKIFQPRQSKYTRYADDLVSEIHSVVGDLTGYALLKRIAGHVAERFSYGHPDTPFNHSTDIIPAIGCGTIELSRIAFSL